MTYLGLGYGTGMNGVDMVNWQAVIENMANSACVDLYAARKGEPSIDGSNQYTTICEIDKTTILHNFVNCVSYRSPDPGSLSTQSY